jgi:hypothetical protein
MTLSITNTQHDNTLHYAECRYRLTYGHDECRDAECHYAECRGAAIEMSELSTKM